MANEDLTKRLWQRFHRDSSQRARAELIEHYTYLVRATRKRLAKGQPAHVEFDDLEGAGYVALVEAVDNYDPHRGAGFETFAITCIRRAILAQLEKDRREHEIGFSDEEWDSFGEGTADDSLPLYDSAFQSARKKLLAEFIDDLSDEQRQIIFLYYQKEVTLKEIAGQMGIDLWRVKELHSEALDRMREIVSELPLSIARDILGQTEIKEDTRMSMKTQFRTDRETRAMIDMLCREKGCTPSELYRTLIREAARKEGKNGK